MRTNVLRLMFPAMLVALAWGRVTPAHAHSDVLDFSTCGTPNDPAADNTAALIDALEDRTSTNERMVIYFPAGDWYFQDELPVNSVSNPDPAIFDNVSFVGASAAMTAQHQEEGDTVSKRRTRFIIDMDSDSDVWWDQERTNRFGPLSFKDIAFRLVDDGSLFDLGSSGSFDSASFRGVHFDRCIFSKLEHYAGADIGNGDPWLIDAGSHGWVLNPGNNSFAIRLTRGYDVNIQNCSIRGFRYGIIDEYCDRLRVDNLHAMIVGKAVDTIQPTGQASVGGHFDDIFIENPVLCGGVFNGQVTDIRCEAGYDNGRISAGVPTVGPRSLPASVEWSITAGQSVINFTFTGTYDCTDYFEPRSVIRLIPEESGEPARYLFITAVTANQLTFAEAVSKCYVGRNITGDGEDVTRFFGNSAIMVGDRASLLNPSFGINNPVPKGDHPELFVVPGTKPMKVAGMTESLTSNADVMGSDPVVVASSVGVQFGLQGGVDWLGSANVPKHPLVNPGGVGPAFDPNIRAPKFDPVNEVYEFGPGRGVGTILGSGNTARNLTFHWWADPENFQGLHANLAVTTTTFTPTLTEFEFPNATAFVDDYYVGRGIRFTSGGLNGLAANIRKSKTIGGNTRLTIYGLPSTASPPANGDTFELLGLPDACYRVGDDANGWIALKLHRALSSGEVIQLRLRVYVPSITPSAPTISIYGGSGVPTSVTLPVGWSWQDVVIDDSEQAPFSGGLNGILLQGSGNAYISEVIADFE